MQNMSRSHWNSVFGLHLCSLEQDISSVLSPQSSTPSQIDDFGTQRLFLHRTECGAQDIVEPAKKMVKFQWKSIGGPLDTHRVPPFRRKSQRNRSSRHNASDSECIGHWHIGSCRGRTNNSSRPLRPHSHCRHLSEISVQSSNKNEPKPNRNSPHRNFLLMQTL